MIDGLDLAYKGAPPSDTGKELGFDEAEKDATDTKDSKKNAKDSKKKGKEVKEEVDESGRYWGDHLNVRPADVQVGWVYGWFGFMRGLFFLDGLWE